MNPISEFKKKGELANSMRDLLIMFVEAIPIGIIFYLLDTYTNNSTISFLLMACITAIIVTIFNFIFIKDFGIFKRDLEIYEECSKCDEDSIRYRNCTNFSKQLERK